MARRHEAYMPNWKPKVFWKRAHGSRKAYIRVYMGDGILYVLDEQEAIDLANQLADAVDQRPTDADDAPYRGRRRG